MGDAHGRIGRVHRLPARSRGPVDVDARLVLLEADLFGLVDLGEDEDSRRRGVDASLGLRDGHALDAVDAAFELQPPVGAVVAGLDGEGDVLVAAEVGMRGGEDLRGPAVGVDPALVHPRQVPGEERGLVAALPRLDLDDRVTGVVGVAGNEEIAEFGLGLGLLGAQALGLGGKVGILGAELLGGGEVVAEGIDALGGGDDAVEF